MSEADFQYYLPVERFRQIEGPVIDLRTPKEYEQGHLHGAMNIPLFTNAEREEVGKTYKKVGRDRAILLGLISTTELPCLESFLI